jgi:hypothetical protein
MNSRPVRIAGALLIAAVWGYFADLRNGEIGWFVGRLIFIPLFVELVPLLWKRRRGRTEG